MVQSVFSVNKNAVCCLTPFPFHIVEDESFGSSHTGSFEITLMHQLCYSLHFPPCPILTISTATSSDKSPPEVGISCMLCECPCPIMTLSSCGKRARLPAAQVKLQQCSCFVHLFFTVHLPLVTKQFFHTARKQRSKKPLCLSRNSLQFFKEG